jgi:hypothetical protein
MSGKDHGYILPEVIDPQRVRLCIEIPDDLNHIIAFWGALQQLQHPYNWQNDEAHTALAAAAVWKDVIYKARESWLAGECASEVICQTYSPRSPRITWFPENPFSPNPTVPDGYLFHPFTVVDTSLISSIISEFGLGYRVGDVYTDLTKLPPGDWGELIEDGYLFFPRFRVNDLNGAGTVKLHLLNIPQGGRALILVDGVFDLFNLQLVELNKDGVSVPSETQVPIVIEVPIETEGDHYVDVIFVPNVNDELIPFFFGGGLRKIEICGFGLEGCDDVSDPCCPDTNDLLQQILDQIKGGFMIVPLAGAAPSDTIVDCTPEGFDYGTSEDDVLERIKRYNALCLTLERYVAKLILQMVLRLNMPSSYLTAALQIPYVAFDNSFMYRAVWLYYSAIVIADVKSWFDETEYKEIICLMLSYLQGKENTFSAFSLALQGIDTATYSDSLKKLVTYTNNNNHQLSVYQEFARELESAYDVVSDTPEFECSCIAAGACDVADFEIILETEGTSTRIDDDTWEFSTSDFTIEAGDVQLFIVTLRDQNWRCFNHVSSTTSQSSYKQYSCAGVLQEGTGGGGGEVVWHEMRIAFPSGSHITAPLVFTINIACPS